MKYFNFIIVFLFLFLACGQKQQTKLEKPAETIRQINARNSKIKSFYCETQANFSISYVFYEKTDKLFINTYFLGKKEAIVSLEDENYWFWIKNFDNKVYYCQNKNISKTRVKQPLRPILIKSFFCVDEIPTSANLICLKDEIEVSFLQQEYKRIIKIRNNNITEQHWFLDEKPILSIYVLEHNIIPKSLKIMWHEENNSLSLKIKNVVINPKEKPDQKMPNLEKINLENY